MLSLLDTERAEKVLGVRSDGPGSVETRRRAQVTAPRYAFGFSESIPGRAFFHRPRVKSGIAWGAPFALIDR